MKRIHLVLIITMLVIGFAAVATNLAINGTINFGFNNNDFDSNVVFTYANTMNGEANINDTGKSISFITKKLENIGQEAILLFDITNKSNQYDANVTIECGLVDDNKAYEEYVDITQDLGDSFTLPSGETKTGKLNVKLKKAYNESLTKDINMVCEIVATPGERNTEGTYIPKEHQYEEILLNGADPVLEASSVEGISLAAETSNKKLIPVIINDDGTVKRADTTKKWYDYENKEWANAVILADGIEDPGINKEIPEDQIESYFVWIPKYRYKIQTVEVSANGQQKAFEIEFGTKDTVNSDTECVAPNESGETGSCAADKWMTHPAFTSFDVNGFWIGKFNVGYNQNDDASVGLTEDWTTEKGRQDIRNASKVIIKPNVYSWNSINLYNTFYTAYDYDRELDSHLTKNTEWGALAYLTHSKYGLCEENGTCAEIAQNNNVSMVTGYAGLNATHEYLAPGNDNENSVNYFNTLSVLASSTQNYTGVFDVSGGTYDRVSAISVDQNKQRIYGYTGFDVNNFPKDLKYFDFYNVYDTDNNPNAFLQRILGDATAETQNWYGNGALFISKEKPFLVRTDWGLATKSVAGIFEFNAFLGQTSNDHLGFRIVLSPQ